MYGFDRSTNAILLKIGIHVYVIRRCGAEITDFFKITIGSCKLVHLFILSCTHGITFAGRFECIGRMACALPKPVSHPPLLS